MTTTTDFRVLAWQPRGSLSLAPSPEHPSWCQSYGEAGACTDNDRDYLEMHTSLPDYASALSQIDHKPDSIELSFYRAVLRNGITEGPYAEIGINGFVNLDRGQLRQLIAKLAVIESLWDAR